MIWAGQSPGQRSGVLFHWPWASFALDAERWYDSVDGYAVQHPGVPGPQANQSVCGHLMNLCRVLERGGNPTDGPAFLAGLTHRAYPWLKPPPSVYPVTVVDLVAEVDLDRFRELERRYADGIWEAWSPHHATIRRWVADPPSLPRRTG